MAVELLSWLMRENMSLILGLVLSPRGISWVSYFFLQSWSAGVLVQWVLSTLQGCPFAFRKNKGPTAVVGQRDYVAY